MAQLVECLTLDLSLGLDLRVEFKPHVGLQAGLEAFLKIK